MGRAQGTRPVAAASAGTLTDASFERLLQVSAVLFFIGAVISAVTITNRTVTAERVPNEVAAFCSDFPEGQPAVVSRT
jgi:flagellar motor component MotA